MQRTFRQNYYDTTVEALRVIVFNKYSLSRLLVFAKYLECMVYLVRKVGPDNFKEQEAIQVSISDYSILKLGQIIQNVILKTKVKIEISRNSKLKGEYKRFNFIGHTNTFYWSYKYFCNRSLMS